MKLLGVLGGMGPGATADFLAKLTACTTAGRDQDHVPTILYSNPSTPDRSDALLGIGPSPLPAMLKGIRFLNEAGCELVAIPCNTAHAWYSELEQASPSPILHIVDAVGAALGRSVASDVRIGVLATAGTIRARIYQERLGLARTVLLPDAGDETGLAMSAVRAVKAGALERGRDLLMSGVTELRMLGAEAVVLGCTDLSSVAPGSRRAGNLPLIDASLALADHCVGAAKGYVVGGRPPP